MGLRVVRRLMVLMTVLLLGLGIVARDAMAADMGAMMSAVSAETADANGCETCGGDDGMSAEDCHAVCSDPTAVLPRPEPAQLVAGAQRPPRIMPGPPGMAAGPEPPPPKAVAVG